MLSFSSKIEGNLMKTFNYLPYKYSIFFQKPLLYSKKDIQINSSTSKKLYQLINSSEKKICIRLHVLGIKSALSS